MPVALNVIRQPWYFTDADGVTPLTGKTTPADITFQMKRYISTGSVTASETITFPELGAGWYDITFTPQNSGLYTLILQELIGEERSWPFAFEIVSAGAAYLPSYANAFCSEADIERRLQKSIDTATNPNDTETTAFAQTRAMVLRSLCGSLGYPVSPSTITAGSILEGLLRAANEIGAALDYELAQQYRVSPSKSDRIADLAVLWTQYVGDDKVTGLLEIEIRGNLASLATDHIISGDTIAATPTYPQDPGPLVSMRDVY
jgi:hypothetical protein